MLLFVNTTLDRTHGRWLALTLPRPLRSRMERSAGRAPTSRPLSEPSSGSRNTAAKYVATLPGTSPTPFAQKLASTPGSAPASISSPLSRRTSAQGAVQVGTCFDHLSLGLRHLCHALAMATPCYTPTPENEWKDDEEEDEMDSKSARQAFVFLPTDSWKESWDLVVLVFIIYSAVTVPYRICFSAHATGLVAQFEYLGTAVFIVDVIFNFNTSFIENDKWVVSRGQIAGKYMQGWFWIDFPSSVPVELLDAMMDGEQTQLGMLRFLRMFRLLRLLRLLKLGGVVADIEERYDVNLTILRIVEMLVKLIFLAHMLACFWFYTAFLVGLDEDIPTWVSAYDGGSGLYLEPHEQYLYSMYWALTTLTTVGYGDITPSNSAERMYALMALLIGALVFGYMLSSIGSLVAAMDRQSALTEDKMDAIKEYMRSRKLPRELMVRMRRYYEHYFERKTSFDEHEILDGLTPDMRADVVRHVCKDSLGKMALFNRILPMRMQVEFFMRFKPLTYAPKEIIYERNEQATALFFVLKGSVEAVSSCDGRQLYRVKPRQIFGEDLLLGRPRASTYRALGGCELFALTLDDLHEVMGNASSDDAAALHAALLKEHIRKTRLRQVALWMMQLSLRAYARDAMNPLNAREEMAKHMAAIQLGDSWDQHCNRIALECAGFKKDDPTAKPSFATLLSRRVMRAPGSDGEMATNSEPHRATPSSEPQTIQGADVSQAGHALALSEKVEQLQEDMRTMLQMMANLHTKVSQGIALSPDRADRLPAEEGVRVVRAVRRAEERPTAVNSSADRARSPRYPHYAEDGFSPTSNTSAMFPSYRATPPNAPTSPRQYMARMASERMAAAQRGTR